MCRHVARRALRFGFTTGTRIYTTQIHKRLCCCYYSCIEAELPPQIRKDDCIFCHFHAVIRRDWLRTGGPDIRSTDLCTFFYYSSPNTDRCREKKTGHWYLSEKNLLREKQSRDREREKREKDLWQCVRVSCSARMTASFLSAIFRLAPFVFFFNCKQISNENGERDISEITKLSLSLSPFVFFHCAFGTRLNVRPEIRNGTEIGHTFGFLLT
jgi:hypothetical protein